LDIDKIWIFPNKKGRIYSCPFDIQSYIEIILNRFFKSSIPYTTKIITHNNKSQQVANVE